MGLFHLLADAVFFRENSQEIPARRIMPPIDGFHGFPD